MLETLGWCIAALLFVSGAVFLLLAGFGALIDRYRDS